MPLRSDFANTRGAKPPKNKSGTGRPTFRTEIVDASYKQALCTWAIDPDYPTPVLLEEMFSDEMSDGFTVDDLRRCLRFERTINGRKNAATAIDGKALCTVHERQCVEAAIKRWGKKYNLPGWQELDAPLLDSQEDVESKDTLNG